MGRPVEIRDLRKHRHIVVRDSGSKRDKKSRTLEVAQRWTVSNMSTSIGAVSRGYGFAFLPMYKIYPELYAGELKQLELRDAREFSAPLYLIFADRDGAGPGQLRLAQLIREEISGACSNREEAMLQQARENTEAIKRR